MLICLCYTVAETVAQYSTELFDLIRKAHKISFKTPKAEERLNKQLLHTFYCGSYKITQVVELELRYTGAGAK